MKGCNLDTDGDGNCPVHPDGCPPLDIKPSVDFIMGEGLPDCLLDAQERAARAERRVPRWDVTDVETVAREHDWQPTSTWFKCSACGKEAPAPHAGASNEPCPGPLAIPIAMSDLDSKPVTAKHKTTMAACPCCTQPMVWDEPTAPEPYDWCQECRSALDKLAEGEDDESRQFRRLMLDSDLANAILAKSV